MGAIRMQARLAAQAYKCGRRRIWLDPNEDSQLQMANSAQQVKKMKKDGVIMVKPKNSVSRTRWRVRQAAKAKGRHSGRGKRKGCRESRMPSKILWVRRIRVLRRLLKKCLQTVSQSVAQSQKSNLFTGTVRPRNWTSTTTAVTT